jgi:hypothetical protein
VEISYDREMKAAEIEVKLLKHDRRLAAIQKLISTGMQLVVRNSRQIAQLTKNVNTLVRRWNAARTEAATPAAPGCTKFVRI